MPFTLRPEGAGNPATQPIDFATAGFTLAVGRWQEPQGEALKAEFYLPLPNNLYISSHHCTIQCLQPTRGSTVVGAVFDYSSNGTRINGKRVRRSGEAPGVRAEFSIGDIISLSEASAGAVRYRVEAHTPASPPDTQTLDSGYELPSFSSTRARSIDSSQSNSSSLTTGPISTASIASQQSTPRSVYGFVTRDFSILRRTGDVARDYKPVHDGLLGTGACASVYLVQSTVTGEVFALKRIQKANVSGVGAGGGRERKVGGGSSGGASGSSSVVDPLAEETAILRGVKHPNIVRFIDAYDTPHDLFMVLEYANHGDLFGKLSSKTRFPEQHARSIMSQILKAVKYLHGRRIAHRDLKPENILLHRYLFTPATGPASWRYAVKIADFGMSRMMEKSGGSSGGAGGAGAAVQREGTLARTHTIVGTPGYLPPESYFMWQSRVNRSIFIQHEASWRAMHSAGGAGAAKKRKLGGEGGAHAASTKALSTIPHAWDFLPDHEKLVAEAAGMVHGVAADLGVSPLPPAPSQHLPCPVIDNDTSLGTHQTRRVRLCDLQAIDHVVEHGYSGFAMDSFSLGAIMYVLLAGRPMTPDNYGGYPSVLQQLLCGMIDFPTEDWQDISIEARDLILSLCRVNPAHRLTPEQALNHAWILGKRLNEVPRPELTPPSTFSEQHIESQDTDSGSASQLPRPGEDPAAAFFAAEARATAAAAAAAAMPPPPCSTAARTSGGRAAAAPASFAAPPAVTARGGNARSGLKAPARKGAATGGATASKQSGGGSSGGGNSGYEGADDSDARSAWPTGAPRASTDSEAAAVAAAMAADTEEGQEAAESQAIEDSLQAAPEALLEPRADGGGSGQGGANGTPAAAAAPTGKPVGLQHAGTKRPRHG